MKLERLTDFDSEIFKKAIDLYELSFPVLERRDEDEQYRVLKNENYCFDVITDNDEFIGIMLYWEVNGLIYLEHFATRKDIRGKGYGAKALELLKASGKPVLLEIELPVDELTKRRYGFYKRNGFVMNPYKHIQAKYRQGDSDLELKVLTYPQVVKKEDYDEFYEYMLREIAVRSEKQ